MYTPRRRYRIYSIIFQKTSMIPITRKSSPPFGISTTTFYIDYSARRSPWNAVCTKSTIFIQLVASGISSIHAYTRKHCRCYTCIPDPPLRRLEQIHFMAHYISASSSIELSNLNGSTMSFA